MEVQNNKPVTEFSELMNKTNYFTKLKENTINNSFSVPVKVSGYEELNLIASNLLKASIFMLKNDGECLSNSSDIDVISLLELALQLLPEDEMELLDELNKRHL
jgi:beta-glucosidase-like glycosyl hydrolase